jgi:histidine triad (HIT) family protein
MNLCIFCKIINKEAPATVVFENEEVLALVPIGQVTKGHTLVIPKKHFENVFDIETGALQSVIAITKDLAPKLCEQYGATGVNLLNASGKDAQQSVFHFHMHIVPRYKDDGMDLWLREKL